MLKEIREQSRVVSQTLAQYIDPAGGQLKMPNEITLNFRDINRVSIVACGTGCYAGLIARYWFERYAALPAEIENAARWLEELGPPAQVSLVPGNHDAYVPRAAAVCTWAWAPYIAGDAAEGVRPIAPTRSLSSPASSREVRVLDRHCVGQLTQIQSVA